MPSFKLRYQPDTKQDCIEGTFLDRFVIARARTPTTTSKCPKLRQRKIKQIPIKMHLRARLISCCFMTNWNEKYRTCGYGCFILRNQVWAEKLPGIELRNFTEYSIMHYEKLHHLFAFFPTFFSYLPHNHGKNIRKYNWVSRVEKEKVRLKT